MLNLCVKLWYVRDWYVTKLCVKLLYVKVVCEREEAGGGTPDTESKTRTPHKVVGKRHSVSRLSYLFAHLHLLSSDLFSSDFSPL